MLSLVTCYPFSDPVFLWSTIALMGEEDEMKRRHHTPRKLREADRMLGEGSSVVETCKHLIVSEQTYYRWRNQYGGMKADDAK